MMSATRDAEVQVTNCTLTELFGSEHANRNHSDVIDVLMNKLDNCQEALWIIHAVEEAILRCGCFRQIANITRKAKHCIETAVLNLASTESIHEGIFYCTLIEDRGQVIARYLEASLPFQGFLQNNVQTLCDTINRQTVHLYPIHTDEDIKRHADLVKEKCRNKAKFAQKTSSGKNKTRSRIGEKWKRLVLGEQPSSQCLNSEALAMHKVIHQKCHIMAYILIARRAYPKRNRTMHSFMTAGGFADNKATVQHWNELLNAFSLREGTHTSVSLKQICDSDRIPNSSTAQFRFISCLNNYHWGSRPRKIGGGYTSSKSHIPLSSHFSYTLPKSEVGKPCTYGGHLPNSSRNLIIYYSIQDYNRTKVRSAVSHMLKPSCQNSCSTDQNSSINPKRQRTMNSSVEYEKHSSGEKAFHCGLCESSFITKDYLENHVNCPQLKEKEHMPSTKSEIPDDLIKFDGEDKSSILYNVESRVSRNELCAEKMATANETLDAKIKCENSETDRCKLLIKTEKEDDGHFPPVYKWTVIKSDI